MQAKNIFFFQHCDDVDGDHGQTIGYEVSKITLIKTNCFRQIISDDDGDDSSDSKGCDCDKCNMVG